MPNIKTVGNGLGSNPVPKTNVNKNHPYAMPAVNQGKVAGHNRPGPGQKGSNSGSGSTGAKSI